MNTINFPNVTLTAGNTAVIGDLGLTVSSSGNGLRSARATFRAQGDCLKLVELFGLSGNISFEVKDDRDKILVQFDGAIDHLDFSQAEIQISGPPHFAK